jgi:DNA-binding transcriptional MerR regulator
MSSVSLAERTAQSRRLTIQEMSQRSGLSVYTLRYYERIGLLKPIPRNQGSGHRLYSPETVALVESLSCLRATGMSIEDMGAHLRLRQKGKAAATEHRVLFAAHKAVLEREMELMRIRLSYLEGKIAYWQAVEAGDAERVERIVKENRRIGSLMKSGRGQK